MIKAIPELSADVRFLADRLAKANVGDVVSYEDLSTVIGRDVRGRARSCLASARRVLIRDRKMVFEAVTNVGLKLLSSGEVVRSLESNIRRVHRTCRRGVQKLATVDPSALSKEQVVEMNVRAAHLGALLHLSDARQTKKLEAAVQKSQQSLPVAKTLEAFI